nr:hypothetical protein [Tanacetum cinerariifolium]
QKKQEEKQIEEEQAAKAQTWKLSDDDDDEENRFEDLSDSNEEFSSTDDDSFSLDNIDYVEASPPNSELVSSEDGSKHLMIIPFLLMIQAFLELLRT